ncbi:diacylglycerol kinase family protein [Brevundimonas sp. NIBR11]|uniref:diacylglycerol/lipid kinase family protein n=1 Tax=Brevundimonas sp. NIBR11 TaxID=3015999 RepID=UPI0022F0289F|nr:diacylglycerol kinase family protein [Brevundimonas sp. NIBR11]WGM32770.1 hypothetical protein KKHFBJBL_03024 [Brevundimonas sp. NIBR11]
MTETIQPHVDPSTSETVASEVQGEGARALTSHVEIKRVVVLVNPLSGSVGPRAAAEVERIMADYPCEAEVVELVGDTMNAQIDAALASEPDVLFVLAGDGTARAAASKAGPKGPLVAPLPGGTMNMLPKALYGTTDWKAALRDALENGAPHCVSGGKVEGEAFYCAGIFGSPALWAPAREAVREGKLNLAWTYGRRALRRAFSGKIRVELDLGKARRSEALALISPMISRALDEPVGLEAAAMNPADAAEAFRLAANAVFSDWRQDPSVVTQAARLIRIRGRSRIPAVLDGEPTLLPNDVTVVFIAKAFQALVPEPPAAEDSV